MTDIAKDGLDHEFNKLGKDTQALLHNASDVGGEAAEAVRQRGQQLLDSTLSRMHDVQARTLRASKEAAASADHYVHENPWRMMALAAGIGLLAGMLLRRH